MQNRKMLLIKLSTIMLILFIVCQVSLPASSSAATYTLTVIADADTDSSHPNNNYGTSSALSAFGSMSKYINGFLKFDLSAIPDNFQITSAKLYLYCSYNTGENSVPVAHVSNDSWIENSITYNNQPDYGYSLDYAMPIQGQWVSWELTTFNQFGDLIWDWPQDLQDNFLSLMLIDQSAMSFSGSYYYSKEAVGAYAPYLVIIAGLPIELGDVDKSGAVDLKDTIIALQIASGLIPNSQINLYADVNGDSKIGIEEAVYTLQIIAGEQ